MSKKDWRIRVDHTAKAIKDIQSHVAGMDEIEFQEDLKTFQAVERNLQIIAEAVKNIPKAVLEEYPEIPWSGIITTRNVITHDYDQVSQDLIWKVITDRLPDLEKAISDIQEKYKKAE